MNQAARSAPFEPIGQRPRLRPVARLAVELHERISTVDAAAWRALLPPERLFLDPDYLRALEESRPPRISFRYAVWREGHRIRAVAAFQLVDVSVDDCPGIASDALNAHQTRLAACARKAARAALRGRTWRILLCGNVFISGEYGFQTDPTIDAHTGLAALTDTMALLAHQERADFLMIKEYPPGECDPVASAGYVEIPLDPCTALRLRSEWRSMSDYSAALTSKARGHVRRARQAGAAVVRRELDARAIARCSDQLDVLYGNVLARARVRPSVLDASAFARFSERLGSRFSLVAYTLGDRMLGFNTRFVRGAIVEGYHLGLSDEDSASHALYRNTMYDDVEHAIRIGAKAVALGRGAYDVKSSIGAEPVPVTCAFRHVSGWLTAPIRPLAHFMITPGWTARRAFRTEEKSA